MINEKQFMRFKGKLIKIGKDYGVIIPKRILKKMNIKVGERLLIEIHPINPNN